MQQIKPHFILNASFETSLPSSPRFAGCFAPGIRISSCPPRPTYSEPQTAPTTRLRGRPAPLLIPRSFVNPPGVTTYRHRLGGGLKSSGTPTALVGSFRSTTAPDDDAIVSLIEANLPR